MIVSYPVLWPGFPDSKSENTGDFRPRNLNHYSLLLGILHKYLQFGRASSAAVTPTPITPGCSPCAPLLVMAPPGSATSLPPHCTCLSLGPHAAPVLQHLATGQILPRPQARWRAPPIPSCFPLQPHPLCLPLSCLPRSRATARWEPQQVLDSYC